VGGTRGGGGYLMFKATKCAATGGVGAFVGPGEGLVAGGGSVGVGTEHQESRDGELSLRWQRACNITARACPALPFHRPHISLLPHIPSIPSTRSSSARNVTLSGAIAAFLSKSAHITVQTVSLKSQARASVQRRTGRWPCASRSCFIG